MIYFLNVFSKIPYFTVMKSPSMFKEIIIPEKKVKPTKYPHNARVNMNYKYRQ